MCNKGICTSKQHGITAFILGTSALEDGAGQGRGGGRRHADARGGGGVGGVGERGGDGDGFEGGAEKFVRPTPTVIIAILPSKRFLTPFWISNFNSVLFWIRAD